MDYKQHIPDLPTSYAGEIIARLIVQFPETFEEILDRIDEDCYDEVLEFLWKCYDEDDPDLGVVQNKLDLLRPYCTLCNSKPCQCKKVYAPIL